MSADVKSATPDPRLWSEGGGPAVERILIRYRGLSTVRTAVSPGRLRASGVKGCVFTAPPLQVLGHDAIGILRASGHRNLAAP
jgi:hypothetical protein